MSDQDFFFDEDEQPTKAEPAKKASASTKAAPAAAATSAGQGVSMAVASLIGVIALLAGVIVGILLPIGNTPATTGTTATQGTTGGTGGQSAPQLSPEQLQQGELPQGHPDISGLGGGAGGSKETTSKK